MDQLLKEFARIKREHAESVLARSARVVLGSSVIRVFDSGTKPGLVRILEGVAIDELKRIRSQTAFKKFFERELARVSRGVRRLNPDNARIYPGYKWGHSTKVLCLFLRTVVLESDLLPHSAITRLRPLLYAPIDGVIIHRLQDLEVELPFQRIKDIDSQRKFYKIQDLLGRASRRAEVPRIWFDDNWVGNRA
ncbi:hypothetical protein ACFL6M_04375 [Candidatus Eisenbacteria bacterium]|uniref:Uncharacterized protein n=1 Tax=Eiseniibacteriota bacterium TaxID=2212470 RepID=A0ABV6YKE6_UNCEI